jgi:hypothetical protein
VFVFDDEPDAPISVSAGAMVAIPPRRQHHLELDGPATFVVEFHRIVATESRPVSGHESTGLDPR